MEEDKINLLSYLKDQLDNRSIVIQTELAKIVSHEKSYFTDKEKLEAMMTDNPSLQELRLKLGLELD